MAHANDEIMYSAHTFILPLRWDVVREDVLDRFLDNQSSVPMGERLDIIRFAESMLRDGSWELLEDVEDIAAYAQENDAGDGFAAFKDDESVNLYKEYCFFYDYVRQIMYNNRDIYQLYEQKEDLSAAKRPSVLVFERKIRSGRWILSNPKTFLSKDAAAKEDALRRREYVLQLFSIQARVYESGTLLVSFHCKNQEYRSIEQVCEINCWGRRLYTPYLREGNTRETKWLAPAEAPAASRIEFDDGSRIDIIQNGYFAFPEHLAFLRKLLSPECVSLKRARHHLKAENAQPLSMRDDSLIVLDCFNDERMFVHSYLVEDALSSNLQIEYPRRKAYICSHEPGMGLKQWYSFLVADIDANEPTCPSWERMVDELSRYTYDRWGPQGTFHGVTDNSFLMVTNQSAVALARHIFSTFDWNYFQISCIALLYRTSILRFNQEASGVLSVEKTTHGRAALVESVHQCYMRFLNCIWFREITAQRQGQEIFEMLSNQMQIEKDVDVLDKTFDEMQRYESGRSEDRKNNLLLWLAIIGGIYTVLDLICMFVVDLKWSWPMSIGRVIGIIPFSVCIYCFARAKTK